jgi:hypothetical protein
MYAHVPSSPDVAEEGSCAAALLLTAPDDFFDTSEVRWFADGVLPPSLVAWFASGPTSVEIRCDRYWVDGSPDFGLKRRGGGQLELKLRCDASDAIALGVGLHGRIEEWRKFSPIAEEHAPSEGSWVEVEKLVQTRSYHRYADGPLSVMDRPDLSTTGCEIELAAVTVGELKAWTFAFEAWGEGDLRRATLRAAMAALVSESPLPRELLAGLGPDAGYPAWLNARR